MTDGPFGDTPQTLIPLSVLADVQRGMQTLHEKYVRYGNKRGEAWVERVTADLPHCSEVSPDELVHALIAQIGTLDAEGCADLQELVVRAELLIRARVRDAAETVTP